MDEPCIIDEGDDLAQGPVRNSIKIHAPDIANRSSTEVLIPMFLDGQQKGLVLLFFPRPSPTLDGSPLTVNVLVQVGASLAVAFGNRRIVDDRKRASRRQHKWLQKVTHQFVAPVGAVFNYAELLSRRLDRWERENPDLYTGWNESQLRQFENSIEAIRQLSLYASGLAHNFAHVVYGKRDEIAELVVAHDLTGDLIQIARDFQGAAAARGIRKVEVDTDSLQQLNGRVRIILENMLFRQAVGNLIDNAVKYSYPGAEVIITGHVDGEWGVIEVINDGIQLPEGEEKAIFEYYYRAENARLTDATGIGIGLSVAQDILEQHGGSLTARPSEPGAKVEGKQWWHTVFTIRLPLHNHEGSENNA